MGVSGLVWVVIRQWRGDVAIATQHSSQERCTTVSCLLRLGLCQGRREGSSYSDNSAATKEAKQNIASTFNTTVNAVLHSEARGDVGNSEE